jgi:hypothetical protein
MGRSELERPLRVKEASNHLHNNLKLLQAVLNLL